MYLNKKIVNGFITIFSSTILISILGYFIRVLLARNLEVSEYGHIYSIIAIFGIFGVLIDFGLNSAVSKFISEFNAKKKLNMVKKIIFYPLIIHVTATLIVSIILSIVLNFTNPGIFVTGIGKTLFYLYTAFFILFPIVSILKSSFLGFHKPIYYSLLDGMQYALVLLFTFFSLKLNLGIYSLFISYIVFAIIGIIISYIILIKKVFPSISKYKLEYDKKLLFDMVKFGVFILIFNLFNNLFGKVDSILLTVFATLEEVGAYNVILPTTLAIVNLVSSLLLILLPVVSELWAKKKIIELNENIKKIYIYLLMMAIPISIAIYYNSYYIIYYLFGEKYVFANPAFKLLVFSVSFIIITRINSSILAGVNEPKKVGIVLLIAFMINVILSSLLIPKYGILGPSFSAVCAFGFAAFFSFILLKKKLNFNINKEFFLLVLINIVLFFVFGLISNFNLNLIFIWIIEIFLLIIYIGICAFVKIFRTDELVFYARRLFEK